MQARACIGMIEGAIAISKCTHFERLVYNIIALSLS